MLPDDLENQRPYEVRLTEPAETEVDAAYLRQMQFGERAAQQWYARFARALETLTQFPHAFALAPGSRERGENVRQMIFGRGRAAYRVLYRVMEPAEDLPGIVRIAHVYHAMQQPVAGSAPSEDEEDNNAV